MLAERAHRRWFFSAHVIKNETFSFWTCEHPPPTAHTFGKAKEQEEEGLPVVP